MTGQDDDQGLLSEASTDAPLDLEDRVTDVLLSDNEVEQEAAESTPLAGVESVPLPSKASSLTDDDLCQIDGIDSSTRNALMQIGIENVQQLSVLDDEGISRISGVLDIDADRIRGEGWISQAQKIAVVAPVPETSSPDDEDQIEDNFTSLPEVSVVTEGPAGTDDLTAIEGIGPATEKLLNLVGITSFKHIAALSPAEQAELSVQLELEDRIAEDGWTEQASRLCGMRDVTVAVGPPSDMEAPDVDSYNPVLSLFKGESVEINLEIGVVYTETPDHEDDLTLISGIGIDIQVQLHTCGIYCYRQIANWNAYNVHEVSRRLAFKDRIEREQWVKQAKGLQLVCPKHSF